LLQAVIMVEMQEYPDLIQKQLSILDNSTISVSSFMGGCQAIYLLNAEKTAGIFREHCVMQ
jgi:hypothetical protein